MDIVERARADVMRSGTWADTGNLILEMAEEIEKLRADIAEAVAAERKKVSEDLIAFLAIWAVRYQHEHELDGLHPTHYDLMEKYGCFMGLFSKATNAAIRNRSQP